MNIIHRHALSTILIFLTALVLAGCAPNYYTRGDGLKMSTEERIKVCKRLRSAAGVPDQYNINLPSSSAYRQQENLSEIRRQARQNAEESMRNLNCHSVLAESDIDYLVAKQKIEKANRTKLLEEMRLPPAALRNMPSDWGGEPRPAPDMTGKEWLARTNSPCVWEACPKSLRFLPQGRLAVSEELVVWDTSKNRLEEDRSTYGRAEDGEWMQVGSYIYMHYKTPKKTKSRGNAIELVMVDMHLYAWFFESKTIYIDRVEAEPKNSSNSKVLWTYSLARR